MRLVALLAAVLATCGVAAAHPLMSRSAAGQLARSSNLKASDAPGFDATPSAQAPGYDLWGGSRYARCANRKGYGKDLADVLSPSFERDAPGQFDAFGSEVMVMSKESFAQQDLAIAKSKLGQRCIKREMTRLKPQGVALDNFNVNRLGGFNNGVAYRIKMIVTTQGVQVPIYADLFVFAERQVEGSVFFISGPNPPTRSDENHYVNLVQTRVDKQVYKNDVV
jgi:hypothetical protein